LLRRRSGRHAQPTATTPLTPSRSARAATYGIVLLSLLAGAGAVVATGVTLGEGDEAAASALTAPLSAPSSDAHASSRSSGSRSQERAPVVRTVRVTVDGATTAVTTAGTTVAEALGSAGVVLGHDDRVTPGLTESVEPEGEVVVARVTYVDGYDTTAIPFERVERRDDTLTAGVRRVEKAGVPGEQVVHFRARLVDGSEVSREETMRTVVAPVSEVVRVGTKVVVVQQPPRPAPQPPARRSASSSSRSGGGGGGAPAGPVVQGSPRAVGAALAAARGWSGEQFTCLDRLWTKESNWNPHAENPSSGAYGIPQALPGSKMGTVAADWRTNPATQITWGLDYIEGRYGTPCAAWSHSQAVNWY
jgi:hypothetical protein